VAAENVIAVTFDAAMCGFAIIPAGAHHAIMEGCGPSMAVLGVIRDFLTAADAPTRIVAERCSAEQPTQSLGALRWIAHDHGASFRCNAPCIVDMLTDGRNPHWRAAVLADSEASVRW
jgi:hypothetical protein